MNARNVTHLWLQAARDALRNTLDESVFEGAIEPLDSEGQERVRAALFHVLVELERRGDER